MKLLNGKKRSKWN